MGAWQVIPFADLCSEFGGGTIVRGTLVLGDPEVIELVTSPCTIDVTAGATLELRDLRASVSGQRQQVVARLGRMFGRGEDPLGTLHDYAVALKDELRATTSPLCAHERRGGRND